MAFIQADLSTVPGILPALSSVLAGAVSSFTFPQRKILTNARRKEMDLAPTNPTRRRTEDLEERGLHHNCRTSTGS